MDCMSFQTPLKRVRNCFTFNYLEYDTTIPSMAEGRVHPIQFGNSITRINVAARAHRDKSLFLLILFFMGILVLAIYPIMDLTYYLFVVLLFAPLCLIEYITYCFLRARTLKLLKVAVEQENEIFITNGMKLIWEEKSKQIIVEVVRRVSLSYENPILVQKTAQEKEKRLSGDLTRSSSSRSLSSITTLSPAEQERTPLLLPPRSEIEVSDVLVHPSFSTSSSSQFPPLAHFSNAIMPPSHVQIPVE